MPAGDVGLLKVCGAEVVQCFDDGRLQAAVASDVRAASCFKGRRLSIADFGNVAHDIHGQHVLVVSQYTKNWKGCTSDRRRLRDEIELRKAMRLAQIQLRTRPARLVDENRLVLQLRKGFKRLFVSQLT